DWYEWDKKLRVHVAYIESLRTLVPFQLFAPSSPSPNELFGHDYPGSAISPEKLERHWAAAFPGRRGRRTSSPPQLGQTCAMAVAHSAQKVHSNVQMWALASGGRGLPPF